MGLSQLCEIIFLFGWVFLSGEKDSCINRNTYRIDGGGQCNNQPTGSIFGVKEYGNKKYVTFNYVPNHKMRASEQPRLRTFSITAKPKLAKKITSVPNLDYNGEPPGSIAYIFGIATTGVPFDPVANEPWVNTQNGTKNYQWNLEVLSSQAGLNYDCNNAHDPKRYHYHGTPIQYIQTIENGKEHSGFLGYAADGFPIYYKYAYEDPNDRNSEIVALKSSYRIKEGCRPGDGVSAPDGAYDGTYVADYGYVEGFGDLDECNGRWSKTPDYPEGIYAYYITDEFPSIPRCFKGTPSDDFEIRPRGRRR